MCVADSKFKEGRVRILRCTVKLTKQKIDLGNLLCSYYHRLLLSIMKQEDFHLNIFDIIDLQLKLRNIKETPTDLIMYENGDFIRELPLDIPFNTVEDLYFKLRRE